MIDQPNYYSIIPADVRYDNNLKPNEKLLYSEITALCNKDGYCYAGNSYFAKLYNVEKETVSRWLANLQSKGYIKTDLIRRNNKEIDQRKIYLLTKKSIPIDKKINTPIDKKVKENITSNKYSYINKDIVEYLNQKTGKSFKESSSKTKTLIKARLNEGFTLEDFKKVIDIKTEEWLNDSKMNQFLRPETLFSNKFEGYLNQSKPERKEPDATDWESYYGNEPAKEIDW